jgi:hypothetical protein
MATRTVKIAVVRVQARDQIEGCLVGSNGTDARCFPIRPSLAKQASLFLDYDYRDEGRSDIMNLANAPPFVSFFWRRV